MARHGRALGLLLTSAAVVAAGLVATPAGTSSAVGTAPQVVYIDADDRLMVGALDGSDTPRALAPGFTTGWASVSPSGDTVVGRFASHGSYAVVLRNRHSPYTTILSTQGSWLMHAHVGGTALFLDRGGGVYDVSRGGLVTRRHLRGPWQANQSDERLHELVLSPTSERVGYWWTSSYCEQGLVIEDLTSEKSLGRRFPEGRCQTPYGQVLGWLDNDTLLYSYPATSSVDDPQTSVVYSMQVWPSLAVAPTDTGLRGIDRMEHWGSDWWFWRSGGSEYGVSVDATTEPAQWLPVPVGKTLLGLVSSDPPVLGTVVNRAPSEAHLSVQPTIVRVGESPSLLGYAYYRVNPPGWIPDMDATVYDDTTVVGTLYGSIDAGRTWKAITGTSSYTRFPISPLTRNLWLKWRHPGDAFTTASTSIVRKVTATPLITVGARWQPPSGPRQVSGTVTRANGTVKLLRWTGSTWAYVATTSISSTGRFNFGWRSLRAGKYRVSVPATTYWGASSKTFWA